jgi:N-carbamoyl-D-amino-acid hydrolase
MSRILTVGAAQLGPNARNDNRKVIVGRLLDLMRQAHAMKCDLIVYPELALTSFFPRWWMEDQEEIDSFFEHEMPSRDTLALFEEAKRCTMGFYLGFAERTHENNQVRHYNASIIADQHGRIVGKYRKVHLPGHADDGRIIRFSISRSAISSQAISASRSGARSAPMSACASATIGAGPRPIG